MKGVWTVCGECNQSQEKSLQAIPYYLVKLIFLTACMMMLIKFSISVLNVKIRQCI